MSNRAVAFLDILGFRRMVETRNSDELGTQMVQMIGQAIPLMNQRFLPAKADAPTFFPDWPLYAPWVIYYAFSDSVIFVSVNESEAACLALLLLAWRTTQVMIGTKFPVRGAVACGETFVDEENHVFLGKSLTTAYELQARQNWIGVAIDDSIEETHPGILTSEEPSAGVREALFPRYEVPMKDGQVRDYHVLNWRWNLFIDEGTQSRFGPADDWPARQKVDSALAFAADMRRKGLDYPSNPADVPLEARRITFADGPPRRPLPEHGDDF